MRHQESIVRPNISMSMFDEYVEKLKKQKRDHSGDDEARSGVSVDFEGMDIDHDSIKTLQGQIQDSKKTIEAKNRANSSTTG